MKQGSATANTLGTLAVMYSGFGVILQYVRGEDDEVNTLLAGTGTGLLYKSTGRYTVVFHLMVDFNDLQLLFSWFTEMRDWRGDWLWNSCSLLFIFIKIFCQ